MVRAVVIGAAGGIGQPLSLLLKNSPLVKNLALYDVVNAVGVATDLSHISTPAVVEGYTPKDDGMKKAISGADVIVIPAGVPRKPGMTRDDLFNTNASIVRDIATAIAVSAPKAFILVISNPVNSTVPIVAEVMKKHGVFDPKRLFGVTTLDVVRSSQFCAENASGLEAPSVRVPVIGGHSGITIVPLLSQIQPPTQFSQDVIEKLTNRIQFGGDEVVKAKDGAGSATLSMAWAGYRFTEAIIQAMNGKTGIIEPSYVFLEADPQGGAQVRKELGSEISFFSAPIELGPQGVHKIHPIGKMSDYESQLVKAAVPELEKNIAKGVEFLQAKM